jgi:HAE1 family hydrophobic/amphiphilic exporter-1
MTASAAVLGMLPIAIGFGKGSEIQAPMATAVIGGLITSTALTLFVVPTVYSLLDDLGIRLRGKDKYDQREPVPAGDGHYDAVADGVEKDIHAGLE